MTHSPDRSAGKASETAPQPGAPLHMIDLIRRKRDGGALTAREIQFIAEGAGAGSIAHDQLAAWLMAACIRGLDLEEIRALTLAMRDSGEKFSPASLGRTAVDKHSSGGVGDKTSFLVAPLAAACGVAVPMISGRALGHTGGTLDKLESIPGYRCALSLAEFEAVLKKCGASIVSQTPALVPADRVLYALRDRTGTVESPGLICASILSKKLAAGLDALVLDVKTGSGAFLRRYEDCAYLAALMVTTAEAAGTRTVALLTDMDQPLGYAAGNWIELVEAVELLRGGRRPESEDLRELSLILAGWMIHLGGQADMAEDGYRLAEKALEDGSALRVFLEMVSAQGGDIRVFDDPAGFHRPGGTLVVEAWKSGYIREMDTTKIGWAVQRTGAGREKTGGSSSSPGLEPGAPSDRSSSLGFEPGAPGDRSSSLGFEPVDPHAGIELKARRGAKVEAGQPIAVIYATTEEMLREPGELLREAITISDSAPEFVPLVSGMITRENAKDYLRNAVR